MSGVHRTSRLACAIASALVATLGARVPSAAASPASEHPPAFTYAAPAGCPSEADVRARIERRFGAAIDGAIHGLEISIVRMRGGLEAVIDARAITVAAGFRTLRSARCDELADAIAVVVARLASEHARDRVRPMATDDRRTRIARSIPAADLRGPDEERGVVLATVRVDAPPDGLAIRARRRPVDDAAVRGGSWGLGVHLLGTSGVGALPAVNVGAELGGTVRRADRFVQLALARWVPGAGAMAGPGSAHLDVVSARVGWGPHHLPLRAWVLGELGRVSGSSSLDDDASERWTAVGGGFGVAWPMAPQARLIGTVELAIPVGRPAVVQSGVDIFQPSAATARCSFGLEVGWR